MFFSSSTLNIWLHHLKLTLTNHRSNFENGYFALNGAITAQK